MKKLLKALLRLAGYTAAIAPRSRAGRNSAVDRDHRRHRIRWSGSRRWAGDYSDDAATVSRRAAARSGNPRGR